MKVEVGKGGRWEDLYSGRAKRRGASRGWAGATKPGGEGRDTEIITKILS